MREWQAITSSSASSVIGPCPDPAGPDPADAADPEPADPEPVEPLSAMKRGRISVGTFTRANTGLVGHGIAHESTARLSDRLEMYGNGRPGATARGVSAGKITFW